MSEFSQMPRPSESSVDVAQSGARFTEREARFIRRMKRPPRRIEDTDPEFISVLQQISKGKTPTETGRRAVEVELDSRGKTTIKVWEYALPKVK